MHRTLDMRPLSEPGRGAPRHPGSPTPGRPHPCHVPPITRGAPTLQPAQLCPLGRACPAWQSGPPAPDPVQAACGHLEVTGSGIITHLPVSSLRPPRLPAPHPEEPLAPGSPITQDPLPSPLGGPDRLGRASGLAVVRPAPLAVHAISGRPLGPGLLRKQGERGSDSQGQR